MTLTNSISIHTNGMALARSLVQARDVLSKSFSSKCSEHKDAVSDILFSFNCNLSSHSLRFCGSFGILQNYHTNIKE